LLGQSRFCAYHIRYCNCLKKRNADHALLNVTNTIGLRLVSLYSNDRTASAMTFLSSKPLLMTISVTFWRTGGMGSSA